MGFLIASADRINGLMGNIGCKSGSPGKMHKVCQITVIELGQVNYLVLQPICENELPHSLLQITRKNCQMG